jgi:hypothetical protein
MCFQFSTLNFYHPYGYHLKGRKWLVFFVFVFFSLLFPSVATKHWVMVGDGSGAGEEGLVLLLDCLKW